MRNPSPADLIALYERERRDPTPPAAVRDLFADPWGLHIDYRAVILMASWARGAGPNGWPLISLPRADWIAMFESVGYLHNGFRTEARRPREPITLYRGATPAYRDGLSWTTREADAKFYAGRHPHGRMYTLNADPAWLLARINGNVFAPGGEYVVNAPASAIREIDAPARDAPPRILFVCLGNICRSPLAEVILRALAAEEGVPVIVESAGVSARGGELMDTGTLAVAERHGLDGSAHRARQFSHRDLTRFDRIVALDSRAGGHLRYLARYATSRAEIDVRPVLNPWRLPDRFHESAREEIEGICRDVLATLPRPAPEPECEHGKITAADLEHARAALRAETKSPDQTVEPNRG